MEEWQNQRLHKFDRNKSKPLVVSHCLLLHKSYFDEQETFPYFHLQKVAPL